MKILLPVFILIWSQLGYAAIKGEGYEALTSREVQMLEYGLNQSNLPSYCSRTKEFAAKARWEDAPTGKADFILVDKKRRQLHLLRQDQVLATYTVAFGGNPYGHKVSEGDQRTPEGLYFFDLKNSKSQYHLSLRINYPNTKDLAKARERGIQNPGADIMIHGLPNSWIKRKVVRHPRNWTRGCMAVYNYQIEEIYKRMDLGGLIEICP